jgi:hypothetical protein
MDTINWRRLAVAGTLAGVVLIVLAIASTALFFGRQKLATIFQTLAPPTNRVTALLFFLAAFLLMGILLTWWYAAIRPRFGAGPKTAVIAGLSVWLIGVAAQIIKGAALNDASNLPPGPLLPMLYLVVILASTVAGAFVYNE